MQTKTQKLVKRSGRAYRLRPTFRAFTLAELLVSITLLLIAIATVAEVFTVSTRTTSVTAADAEVIAASEAFRQQITDQLSKMVPGLLVIDSPDPTTPRQESPHGQRFMRIRHDRLVFLTTGDRDEYQSFTDPTRGDPANPQLNTASSSQAIVYFGPGIPLTTDTIPTQPQPLNDDGNPNSLRLNARDWIMQNRTILLLPQRDPTTSTSWLPPTIDDLLLPSGMLNGGLLYAKFYAGTLDAVLSSPTRPATAQTIANIVMNKALDNTDLLSEFPSIAGLWDAGIAPRTVSLASANVGDFYSRSGSNFVPHMADFRIEWTDGGRVDPYGADGTPNTGDEDLRTRWFGLRPDPAFDVTQSVLNNLSTTLIPNIAIRRQDVPQISAGVYIDSSAAENQYFRDKVEWSSAAAAAPDAAYRALWRLDTWDHRPKALRLSYRIYDARDRLKQVTEMDLDEDGDFDPDNSPTVQTANRYGRQFSIVVSLP